VCELFKFTQIQHLSYLTISLPFMPPDNILVINTVNALHLSDSTSWLLRKRKRVNSNSFSIVVS